MNKITPKKIMEIIFIFILPLLIIAANVTYKNYKTEEPSQDMTYIESTKYLEYDNFISADSPIEKVLEIPMELLGINTENNIVRMIIDYNVLWFINFITWHLLYLFFDTIMHKVLLRKE